jgi:hypothetical protein
MPKWLTSVIKCSKTMSAKIALVSADTFLKILEKKCTLLNDPVRKLQYLIMNSGDGMRVVDTMGARNIYQTL